MMQTGMRKINWEQFDGLFRPLLEAAGLDGVDPGMITAFETIPERKCYEVTVLDPDGEALDKITRRVYIDTKGGDE